MLLRILIANANIKIIITTKAKVVKLIGLITSISANINRLLLSILKTFYFHIIFITDILS